MDGPKAPSKSSQDDMSMLLANTGSPRLRKNPGATLASPGNIRRYGRPFQRTAKEAGVRADDVFHRTCRVSSLSVSFVFLFFLFFFSLSSTLTFGSGTVSDVRSLVKTQKICIEGFMMQRAQNGDWNRAWFVLDSQSDDLKVSLAALRDELTCMKK